MVLREKAVECDNLCQSLVEARERINPLKVKVWATWRYPCPYLTLTGSDLALVKSDLAIAHLRITALDRDVGRSRSPTGALKNKWEKSQEELQNLLELNRDVGTPKSPSYA